MKQSYFIADLHLTENRPDITTAFFDFLDDKIINDDVDALYILGDFFEVWVGDDYQTTLSERVAAHLRQAAESGTELFYTRQSRLYYA